MDKITCPFAATMVGLFFLVVGGGLAWFGVRRISNMRAKEVSVDHISWIGVLAEGKLRIKSCK